MSLNMLHVVVKYQFLCKIEGSSQNPHFCAHSYTSSKLDPRYVILKAHFPFIKSKNEHLNKEVL